MVVETLRKTVTAVLLTAVGIGAAACEFGEHRGSHSNAYREDDRSYGERNYMRPYQPQNDGYYERRSYY